MARHFSSFPRRLLTTYIGRARLRRRFVNLAYTLLFFYVLAVLLDPSYLTQLTISSRDPSSPASVVASWSEETKDGLVGMGESSWKLEHPIRRLMREAREKWDNQLKRQSRTFEDAVSTYKTRYGRSPPKGFDAWFEFARMNNVLMVDDYDQIHTSITPFLALNPTLLGSRLTELLNKEKSSYELQLSRSSPVNITGERRKSGQAMAIAKLLEGFREFLPEDFGEGTGLLGKPNGDDGLVRLSVSDSALGARIMGEEFRSKMMDLAGRGELVNSEQLTIMEDTSRKGAMSDGLLKACSWTSLHSRRPLAEVTTFSPHEDFNSAPLTSRVSFIKNPLKSYDFCHNPSIVPLHGSYARNSVRSPKLMPEFVLAKIAQSPQILLPLAVGLQDKKSEVASWEEKTINKVFWRGSTTGSHYEKKNDHDWRQSHRIRLDALTNDEGDSYTDVLVETGLEREISMRRLPARDLNEHLFDVGITEVTQCDKKDGTCEEMHEEIKLKDYVRSEEARLYRYALDIDGNGWSSRFRRLVALGQVVFKVTIYPEWNSEWLTPWLHYVPVGLDLSDLYHTSTFFIGAPGVSEGNSDLGKSISDASLDFLENNWRREDMEAYMFRLLLEYRRAMSHDRDAMSMNGKIMLDVLPPPFVPRGRVR